MAYIGSVKDAEKAMSDERRMECPECVEDFAERWLMTIEPIVPVMSDGQKTAACAEAFEDFAARIGANRTLLSGMPAPSPDARRIAALEAELAAARAALAAAADRARALRPTAPKTAPAPIAGALRAWPGYGGISQLTGKPNWV